MRKSDSRTDILSDILRLHDQATSALARCRQVQNELQLYERYLELKGDYRVRWAGPFLVIDGGRSPKVADTEAN